MTERVVAANVLPLYREPSSASEQVTQAITGARVQVAETQDGFARLVTADRYAGWAREAALTVLPDAPLPAVHISTLFAEVHAAPALQSLLLTKLVLGSRVARLPAPDDADFFCIALPDGQQGFICHSCLREPPTLAVEAIGTQAVSVALRLMGTPYLWGGCTPFGIDCSGLTQLAYAQSGVLLLRDADLQWRDRRFWPACEGQPLPAAQLEPGDLVVFSSREDTRATHIGLALGDGRFVHASSRGGGVRVDPCRSPDYAATYLGAIRLLPNADFSVKAA